MTLKRRREAVDIGNYQGDRKDRPGEAMPCGAEIDEIG